jgi:hypothetical protein
MARRYAINVNDDRGVYQTTLGARRVTWETMRRSLEEQYALEDDATFTAEPLTGWAPWRWAIHAHNPKAQTEDVAVCFVDGASEPDLPFGAAPAAS